VSLPASLVRRAAALRPLLSRLPLLIPRGVKAAGFDAKGAVLLVRLTYGDRDAWYLPGGGARPWEGAVAAARRELREETGCGLTDVRVVARYAAPNEGRGHRVTLVTGRLAGEPVPDGAEVADARLFRLDALPATTSPATRRRLAELRTGGPYAADW